MSFRWYVAVAENDRWVKGFGNSLLVATIATVLATIAGVCASFGLYYLSGRWKNAIFAVMLAPMVVPIIIIAISMLFFFSSLGLTTSLAGVIVGHAVLGLPFVVISMTAALRSFNPHVVRAATSLGASPLYTARTVTLPLLMPSVLTGALFAFATSFDEVVVTLFLAPPDQQLLPKVFLEGVKDSITPSVTAAATCIFIISLALMFTFNFVGRHAERNSSATATSN